jgi:O-6-methylguanine DNA methyltransferase
MSAARETIHLTHFDTAFGAMSLASSARGVVACSLPGDGRDRVRTWLGAHLPDARVVEGPGGAGPAARRSTSAVRAVRDYLAGRRRNLALPLDLRGTAFQKKVWSALRRVPYGETISYGELARATGSPNAVRACGSANGANPAPLFVPCHRAIAGDGSLGGFGGGLPLKRRLLALERGEELLESVRPRARGASPGGTRTRRRATERAGAGPAAREARSAAKSAAKPRAKPGAKPATTASRAAGKPAAQRAAGVAGKGAGRRGASRRTARSAR